ncbi:MAG: abortive infection system antitoxin AbiGi family protein [Spirochaetaceae bacterium]|nr:abortive infection system antitoxin AbiGi family protein [Spirochaetaceae bacterium]
MTDSSFVVHFTKGQDAYSNLISILDEEKIRSNTVPWVNRGVVCFTECPWASLLTHVKNYSEFGLGFSKVHVFAAGGGPAYYVRHDYWEKQQWDDRVKSFVTPFWPSYRPNREDFKTALGGKTVDYSHEREWRVPHDFTFHRNRVEFVILPDYEAMAQFPKVHKDEIGRDRFIMVDVYKQIERLWPTHILR